MSLNGSGTNYTAGSSLPQMDGFLSAGWQPLSELMRAIVLRTVEDYSTGGDLRLEALTYMEDEDEEYIFSFKGICQHLGLNPELTRWHIINAKKKISTRRRAA